MATPRRTGMLDPVRVRVRRLQLVVGLGFLCFVVGMIFSSALLLRLQPRIQATGSDLASLMVLSLLSRLWVIAVLPALCYGAARFLELRPWSTAVGGALTGELFDLGIKFAVAGLEGFHRHWLETTVRVLTLAGGIALAGLAVLRARVAAQRAQDAAQRAAEQKAPQYAEFAAEAERMANLREEKPIAPDSP